MIHIKKKYLILTSLIILIIVFISLLFTYISNNQKEMSKIIEAEILVIGSDYLLVTTQDKIDYIINTEDLNYNIGDTIKLELFDIDTTKSPFEANVNNITIIKQKDNNINTEEIKEENTNHQENNQQTEENIQNNTKVEQNNINNEETIITYFESLDKDLTNYDNNDKTLEQKIKDKFVTCIDFIFYDKPINEITFKELTNKTKLKILEITLSIDSKIDSKFPNYKETISNTYQDIKSKIITKYLEITTNICNEDENLCNTAKESFKNIKNTFGITWNFIKELVGNGTTKLKEWYEIWRYN